MARFTREQLSATVRLLAGIGVLALMLVFLRACLSPPPLPAPKVPTTAEEPQFQGGMPPRYE